VVCRRHRCGRPTAASLEQTAGRPVACCGTPLERVYSPPFHGSSRPPLSTNGLPVIASCLRGAAVARGHFARATVCRLALSPGRNCVECPEQKRCAPLRQLGLREQGLALWVVPADAGKGLSRPVATRVLRCWGATPLLLPLI